MRGSGARRRRSRGKRREGFVRRRRKDVKNAKLMKLRTASRRNRSQELKMEKRPVKLPVQKSLRLKDAEILVAIARVMRRRSKFSTISYDDGMEALSISSLQGGY